MKYDPSIPQPFQVCLAAEACGHTHFSVMGDVFYSSEPFHCGDAPKGEPTFVDMYSKARLCTQPGDRGGVCMCWRAVKGKAGVAGVAGVADVHFKDVRWHKHM